MRKRLLVLVLIFAANLALPTIGHAAPEQASKTCGCGQFAVIQAELARAQAFRVAYEEKARELRNRYPGPQGESEAAFTDLHDFAVRLGSGASPIPGSSSTVGAFGYVPIGQKQLGDYFSNGVPDPAKFKLREAEWKKRPGNDKRNLCDREDEGKLIRYADRVSACSAMKLDVMAHEDAHRATCVANGFFNYFFSRAAAQMADEESSAYRGNVARLSALLRTILRDTEHIAVVSGTDNGSAESLLTLTTRCSNAWAIAQSSDPEDQRVNGVNCEGLYNRWTITARDPKYHISCTSEVTLDALGLGTRHTLCQSRWPVKPGEIQYWEETGGARIVPFSSPLDRVQYQMIFTSTPQKHWCTGSSNCAREGVWTVDHSDWPQEGFFIRRATNEECK